MQYSVHGLKLCNYGTTVQSLEKPLFHFGESPSLLLKFDTGVLVEGNIIVVAIDNDRDTGSNSPIMAGCTHTITQDEVTAGEISFPITTRYQKFYDVTNGKTHPVSTFIGVYKYIQATHEYITLCDDFSKCDCPIANYGDPVVILPEEIYYNRTQINAIVASVDERVETAIAAAEAVAAQASAAAATAAQSATSANESKVSAAESASSASSSASTASGHAATASQAVSDATTAKNDAVTAKNSAVDAKNDAVTAKNDAVTAKNQAVTAKDTTQALYNNIIQVIQIPVGHAYNVGVTESLNVVSVTWTDPSNNVTSEGATIAYWQKTRLVMKVGGFPENENDGTVLVDNTVRNQYRTTPFTYSMGAASNYYFALFSCTTGGIWNTSESAPRFTVNLVSFATIRQMLRSGIPLTTIGLSVGGVVNIQTSSRFPSLRWKLVDANYRGNTIEDSTLTSPRAIFIPQYLPCEAGQQSAIQSMFDAPELNYAVTDDAAFVFGKRYYKLVDASYVQLTDGTDYSSGQNISEWTSETGLDVYTKNHSQRSSYGNNNWKDSNKRQWLNSTGTNWFTKQNIYDKVATSSDYLSGFMTGFESGFIELIMKCYNISARNTISINDGGYGGGTDTTLDTFWLPSITEIFGTLNNSISEGMQFDYFANTATTASSRIQRDDGGTARYVWLRSANTGNTYIEYYIHSSGASNSTLATHAYAFLPAMCIA